MNSKPRIFEIVDVVDSPLESAIIINNTKDKNIKCPLCHNKSFITTKYLIQGYDDFLEYDLSKPAFLGFNFEPLYTTESNAKLIVNSLSGCNLAKVDYDDWNQTVYIKLWRKKPFLGAIEITGKCTGGFDKLTQKELSMCPKCGEYALDTNDVPFENVSLDYSKWDGSDIFIFWYDTCERHTVITETGRKKLEDLGFTNLIYKEVFWADFDRA